MPPSDAIHTDSAPAAIGPYSQARRCGDLVFISGQIPLEPSTMTLVEGGIEAQTRRVLDNLMAITEACDGEIDDIAKLTVYLTDIDDFAAVNDMMGRYFATPYPARAVVQVAGLPKGARIEMEAILAF